METIPFFYFDGEDGCDECKALTGYYSDEPERPHPNCDCEFMAAFLDGEFEYRNENESEDEYEEDEGTEEFENDAEIPWLFTETVERTLTGDISCSEEIEEAFDVSSKYDAEETYTEDFAEEAGPGETLTVRITGHYKRIELTAERWFVAEEDAEDGEKIEVQMDDISDEISVPTGISIEVEGGS